MAAHGGQLVPPAGDARRSGRRRRSARRGQPQRMELADVAVHRLHEELQRRPRTGAGARRAPETVVWLQPAARPSGAGSASPRGGAGRGARRRGPVGDRRQVRGGKGAHPILPRHSEVIFPRGSSGPAAAVHVEVAQFLRGSGLSSRMRHHGTGACMGAVRRPTALAATAGNAGRSRLQQPLGRPRWDNQESTVGGTLYYLTRRSRLTPWTRNACTSAATLPELQPALLPRPGDLPDLGRPGRGLHDRPRCPATDTGTMSEDAKTGGSSPSATGSRGRTGSRSPAGSTGP